MEIDFEESSLEWRKNKIALTNGTFAYRCEHIVPKTQTLCKKMAQERSHYCRRHQPPKPKK